MTRNEYPDRLALAKVMVIDEDLNEKECAQFPENTFKKMWYEVFCDKPITGKGIKIISAPNTIL